MTATVLDVACEVFSLCSQSLRVERNIHYHFIDLALTWKRTDELSKRFFIYHIEDSSVKPWILGFRRTKKFACFHTYIHALCGSFNLYLEGFTYFPYPMKVKKIAQMDAILLPYQQRNFEISSTAYNLALDWERKEIPF